MVKRPSKTISRTLLTGRAVAGLGALASIWPATPPARYPHRSDIDALRSDWVKIGEDMQRVIEHENAQLEASKK